MNKRKIYLWISKVISSSTSKEHILPCGKLIENFHKQFKDNNLTYSLNHYLYHQNKSFSIKE